MTGTPRATRDHWLRCTGRPTTGHVRAAGWFLDEPSSMLRIEDLERRLTKESSARGQFGVARAMTVGRPARPNCSACSSRKARVPLRIIGHEMAIAFPLWCGERKARLHDRDAHLSAPATGGNPAVRQVAFQTSHNPLVTAPPNPPRTNRPGPRESLFEVRITRLNTLVTTLPTRPVHPPGPPTRRVAFRGSHNLPSLGIAPGLPLPKG
jgi:hypothetical protein